MSGLLKESTITLITRGISFFLSLGTSIIISRMLGPSMKGAYSLVILIISIISLLVLFGLGSANIYYGARAPEELPTLAGNSIVAGLVLGAIGVIGVELATLIPAFQQYLQGNHVELQLLRLVILTLPLMQIQSYLQEIIRAAGNILRYNILSVVNMLVSLAGLIIFVWILDQGLVGAVWAWSIAVFLNFSLTAWSTLRVTKAPLQFEWAKLTRGFAFGLRLHPGNIAQFLNYRLDVFLIGLFLTSTEIGWYVTATSLAEKLWEIPHAIRTVLWYEVAATKDAATVNNTTARVNRVVFSLTGIMCFILVLLSYPIIYLLYGAEYLPATTVLVFLMPGVWILSIGKLLAVHLAASGQPEVGTKGALISLGATVILDLLLIPHMGISGAAIATSVAYSLSTIVIVYAFLKMTKLKLKDIIWMQTEDSRFLSRAFAKELQRIFSHSTALGKAQNDKT